MERLLEVTTLTDREDDLDNALTQIRAQIWGKKDLSIRLQDDEGGMDEDRESGVATAEAKPELKRPPMYKVILLNDDYTPMEFVVHILEKFFSMNREKATQIMLTVHTEGAATVGIFPRDIAETKSEQVNNYAQENNHPLMSTIEMTDID